MIKKSLACIGLGVGAAALTATVANPVTATAVAASLMGGAAGNYFHELTESTLDRMAVAIFNRHPGIDENHHILLALRQAHLTALGSILQNFDSAWKADKEANRRSGAQRFSEELHRFLREAGSHKATGTGVPTELERAVFKGLPDAFDAALAARGTQPLPSAMLDVERARQEIEAVVIEELTEQTATLLLELPPLFLTAFSAPAPFGWFDLFVRDGAARLKANADFRSIWTAEKIALIAHNETRILAEVENIGAKLTDLLAYAEAQAQARNIAEGFVQEMADRISADPGLDFEAQMDAVRNAIELYEKEIAVERGPTNFGPIVDEAMVRARRFSKKGKSGLARATLRKAADALQRKEDERREQYVVGVTALYNQERDIALAAYDAQGAADAIVAFGSALHGSNTSEVAGTILFEADALHEYGRDKGSNIHLLAEILLRLKLLEDNVAGDDRGKKLTRLGIALSILGQRETSTARLEEAVIALRAALEEWPRELSPPAWAATQSNLGVALRKLGERESGTARLEEAVTAFQAALEERTRERVPLDWAMTQHNLGAALDALGERESGTTRLEEAVTAYRAALEERTRERVPLDWAMTQHNLGAALYALGERENGTKKLQEAVTAFQAALEERTRERVPLDWAATQSNLEEALKEIERRRGNP